MFSRNRTTTVLAVATVVMASFVLTATSALAATIVNTTWTTTTDTTNDWVTGNSSGTWTWTINSGVIVTLGNNTNNTGRLFVGISSNSVNQTLILTSTDGGGILNLRGNHSLDPVLGRLGHVGDTGTIEINGGVSLIGGSNPFRYSTTAGNAITINNGLVDFTGNGNDPFVRESNGFLTFNIADNMATLIVPGQIDDAADFTTTWAGASVTASGSNPLSFDFDSIANETTITAVPEPRAALLGGLGLLALLRRRRG